MASRTSDCNSRGTSRAGGCLGTYSTTSTVVAMRLPVALQLATTVFARLPGVP